MGIFYELFAFNMHAQNSKVERFRQLINKKSLRKKIIHKLII